MSPRVSVEYPVQDLVSEGLSERSMVSRSAGAARELPHVRFALGGEVGARLGQSGEADELSGIAYRWYEPADLVVDNLTVRKLGHSQSHAGRHRHAHTGSVRIKPGVPV